MIDVRGGFKNCNYFNTDEVENVMNCIYLNCNVLFTVCYDGEQYPTIALLQCMNKDIT